MPSQSIFPESYLPYRDWERRAGVMADDVIARGGRYLVLGMQTYWLLVQGSCISNRTKDGIEFLSAQ